MVRLDRRRSESAEGMEKKDGSGCVVVFLLGGMAGLIYLGIQAVLFFQRPDALSRLLDTIKTAGMCAGLAVLALIFFYLFALLASRTPRFKLKPISRDYPLRCEPIELQDAPNSELPPDLPELPGQETSDPFYVLAAITNHGLRLSPLPARFNWQGVAAENAARFRQLSGDRPGPIILPTGHYSLYYLLYRREGDLIYETAPANKAGFSGKLPAHRGEERVKIVVTYQGFSETGDVNQMVFRERPLKLLLVALDQHGQEHPSATLKLYNGLYRQVQSIAVEDDDSWMYRSRPIYW